MIKRLYGNSDPLGFILCKWRSYVVLDYVKGFLVDLACGDNVLVQLHGSGCGIDIDDRGRCDILVMQDFLNLPFNDSSVETVSIVASLNYFEDPVGVLLESRRILKSNGKLLITMSNEAIMKVWHKYRDPLAPKSAISKDDLYKLFLETGFEVTSEKFFMLGINCLYIARPMSANTSMLGSI